MHKSLIFQFQRRSFYATERYVALNPTREGLCDGPAINLTIALFEVNTGGLGTA